MKIAFVGNFRPDNSTENDLRHALGELKVEVTSVQEDDWIASRSDLPAPDGFDLLLWTRTWAIPKERAEAELGAWRGKIVGYHLDRWWGLNHPEDRFPRGRQNAVYTDPYFRWLDWWFTADPQTVLWEAAGVRAVWTPPAVSTRWTFDAEPEPDKYPFDIVFVGHVDGYHPEDQARRVMLDVLTSRYRGRFRLLGNTHPRIVPAELNVLYVSVPVIVGSSVFAGLDSYWSDRLPETLGRGGFLIHPDTYWRGQFTPGVHLECFRPGDWDGLCALIDQCLDDPDRRGRVAAQGAHRVRQHHTYTARMEAMLETVL